MSTLYLAGAEVVILILFLLCLRHAWRRRMPGILQLLAGVGFGVLLEWATIQQLHAYHYGRFTLMLGQVPLMIGVAWGAIIYSAMLVANATTLPYWARPILAGLLGLTIDLAMDTIAIRLGMWDWGRGLAYEFFGVPYANFWAWFWVISSFAASYSSCITHPQVRVRRLAPLIALLGGLLGVLGTNALIVFVIPQALRVPAILLTLGGALALILALRPRLVDRSLPALVFWVPLGFHGYFLIAGLISGVILQPPALLLISLLMLGVTLAIHRPWGWRRSGINRRS